MMPGGQHYGILQYFSMRFASTLMVLRIGHAARAGRLTCGDAFQDDNIMPLLVVLVGGDDTVQHVIPVASGKELDGLLCCQS